MRREKTPQEGMASPPNLTDWTLKKGAFLKAFELAATNVQKTCKKAGISRQTYYNWMQTDIKFSRTVSDIREGMIYDAETQLYKAIKNGNITALIFFLKCRAKRRGYSEWREFTEAKEVPSLLGKRMSREHMRKIGHAILDIAEDLEDEDDKVLKNGGR